MKKLLLTFVCAAAALGVCAAPEKIGFDKLPKSSQEFIQKNFPREVVKDTEMDREAAWDKYTVYFNSGSRVSFEGGKGDWSEIVMKNGAVPATVIPVRIKTYVADNYSQSMVNRLSTMKEGYKVGLTNGLTLYFDKEGKFKKLDR